MEITCYDKYGRVIEKIVQWDVGQSISIKGYDLTSYAPQIHFANANSEKALVVESVLSGGLLSCQVPNSLARENLPIIMYIYDAVGETGKTNTIIKIPVTPRPMPDDVVYTDDVGVISLTEVLKQAREYMNNSLNYSAKAKESEEKAKTSADAAKVSETNAAKSESTASSSATQAAQSAKEAKAYVGSPLVANTVSDMTDQTKVYVYTGSESGYTAGNWYYHNGSAWVSGGVYNSSAANVDKTLTQDGYAADAKVTGDAVSSLKEDKVDKPSISDEGKIPRAKEGGVEWVEVGQPTDRQTENAVTSWLNKHPEATTTVQIGSLTSDKFTNDLKLHTLKDYVTPQMYGISNSNDITNALQSAINDAPVSTIFIPAGQYYITNTITLTRPIKIVGSFASDVNNGTYITTTCREVFTTNNYSMYLYLENITFYGNKGILFSRFNFSGALLRGIVAKSYDVIFNGIFTQLSLIDNCRFEIVRHAVFTTDLPTEYNGLEAENSAFTDSTIRSSYFTGIHSNKTYFAKNFSFPTSKIVDCFMDFFYYIFYTELDTTALSNMRKMPRIISGCNFEYSYRFMKNISLYGCTLNSNSFYGFSINNVKERLTYLTEEEITNKCCVIDSYECGSCVVTNNIFSADNVVNINTLYPIVTIAHNVGTNANNIHFTKTDYRFDKNRYIEALEKREVTSLKTEPYPANIYPGMELIYNKKIVRNYGDARPSWYYSDGTLAN